MGHDRLACSPFALPLPQLPVHFTAVSGQLFGSTPAAVSTTVAPLLLVAFAVTVEPEFAVGSILIAESSALARPFPSTLFGIASATPGSGSALLIKAPLKLARAVGGA